MKRPRGQNLVLLALTMLFLALMVTMTLGLGLRIRQKHELQNLADAAAYSNAVMTARAFNNMALVNRLEVSYWVAQAADQSLISWTAYAHAMGNATEDGALALSRTACGARLPRARRLDLLRFSSEVRAYVRSDVRGPADPRWRSMDEAAGLESQNIQGTIAGLRNELSAGVVSPNPGNLRDELYRQLRTQQLTRQIVALSQQSDISVIDTGRGNQPNSAAGVSLREVDCDFGDTNNGPLTGDAPSGSGLCLRATWNENMLQAAMGARGHAFLTGRSTVPDKIATRLDQIAAGYGVTVTSGGKAGSAYWAARQTHGAAAQNTEAWGDDHGSVTVSAGGCSFTTPVTAHVRSTHLLDTADQHQWSPKTSGGDGDAQPDVQHTMGDCTPLCPSVWVRTVGFQPNDQEGDAWGQPKALVALQRDLTQRTFPWELHFSFPFSATGPAREWDGRGRELHTRAGKGLNISRQTAVATGIAYYHRRDHWDEFPNLLNPFWRATLAPIDVDDSPRDLQRALSAPEYAWQRDAFRSLEAIGYQGLH